VALLGCNTSNEEGLNTEFEATLQEPLICIFPDTIKADSFGNPILDDANNKSCERVELACEGASYEPTTHTCKAGSRHPLAPLEIAEAIPESGDWATIFYWRDEFSGADAEELLDPETGGSDYMAHMWNQPPCVSYDPDYLVPGDSNDYDDPNDVYWDTSWGLGTRPTGFDPNYGLYWKFKLTPLTEVDENNVPRRTDCSNMIVYNGIGLVRGHTGDLRGGISNDANSALYNPDNMLYMHNELSTPASGLSLSPFWTPPGEAFTNVRKIDSETFAHWLDRSTILLGDGDYFNLEGQIIQSIKLYYGPGDLRFFPDEGYRGVDYIEFFRQGGSEGLAENSQAVANNFSAFAATTEISVDQAKTMLRGTLTVIAEDADGNQVVASNVQLANIIDELYTKGDNDANEAELGVIYDNGMIKNALWAPTAANVNVKIYDSEVIVDGDFELLKTEALTFDKQTGIWTYEGSEAELDQKLFRYEVNVFHREQQEVGDIPRFTSVDVVDPYSISLTVDSRYSRYVNIDDEALKPSGWQEGVIPSTTHPENYIFYTGHVRDFSVMDESTTPEHRGKFLAFTETDSAPVQHLQALADAGISHFELMPINESTRLNNRTLSAVNIGNTVNELCNQNQNSEVCITYGITSQDILGDILASLAPASTDSRDILMALANFDSFDFGGNSNLFNAAEGSYANAANDSSRILEMRAMVQALHDLGLQASLNVDFSHTNNSGLENDSVLDKIVPGYYNRRNPATGIVANRSGARDTAPENAMMTKLIADILVTYSKHFNIDAFHLNALDGMPKASVLAIQAAVKAHNENSYFYGSFTNNNVDFINTPANAANLADTAVGSLTTNMQEALGSAALFNQSQFVSDIDKLRLAMVTSNQNYSLRDINGNLTTAKDLLFTSYNLAPTEIINSVANPKSETLFDALQYNLPHHFAPEERIRAHNVSLSIPLLSQGIPSVQMGADLLRSKSMSRDSNAGGDWINRVDFTQQSNNWNVALPIALSDEEKAIELLMDSNIQVYSDNIANSAALFKEFLQIRKSSPLFTLANAEDVIDRIGFHNNGADRLHNVIAMSIDDGIGCMNTRLNFLGECGEEDQRADLDANTDAIFVVINGSESEQTFKLPTNADFVLQESGTFELHDIQKYSTDVATQSAYFSASDLGNKLVVPALTTAVFVKAQEGAQGYGFNAVTNVGITLGTPYNNVAVHLHNSNVSLVDGSQFEYLGAGIYELTTALKAGTNTFTIGDSEQSVFNLGGANVIEAGADTVIGQSTEVNTFEIAEDGLYTFTLNAASPDMPTLSISGGHIAIPYGDVEILARGDFNGWGDDAPLTYDGAGRYSAQIFVPLDSDTFWKFASADWNFQASGGDMVPGVPLTLATLQMTIGAVDPAATYMSIDRESLVGNYLFILDARDPEAPVALLKKLDD
jgi:pullulanase